MNSPILYQRLEGAALLIASTYVYFDSGFSWVYYLLLFFAFDVFIVGYLVNTKIGAASYNFGHSFIAPSFLAVTYLVTDNKLLLASACLWVAHIGFDRALGFGLKFSSGFMHTHLGDIGKK